MDYQLVKIASQAKRAGDYLSTIAARKAALKAAGCKQTLHADLKAAVEWLGSHRSTARLDRVSRRLGRRISERELFDSATAWARNGREPVILRWGTPAERLEHNRKTAILRAYNVACRVAAHGTVEVQLTTDPAEIGVVQNEYLNYGIYGGKHKNRPCRVQDTVVIAPAQWITRVQQRGLGIVDGIMTLDAAPLEAVGCELYAAAFLINRSRSTSVDVERGYIARTHDRRYSYHANTAQAAMVGLAHKCALGDLTLIDTSGLLAAAREHGTASVSIGDAKATGACEYGIKQWCISTGIDYAAGRTTLAVIADAYEREPRPEARATILRVLRRCRSTATV